MSSGIWSELASHESTHVQMLDQLTVGQVDLFSKGFRSVRNFAVEDKKSTVATQAMSGQDAQELTFALEGSLVGDFVNACHLEIKLPALEDKEDNTLQLNTEMVAALSNTGASPNVGLQEATYTLTQANGDFTVTNGGTGIVLTVIVSEPAGDKVVTSVKATAAGADLTTTTSITIPVDKLGSALNTSLTLPLGSFLSPIGVELTSYVWAVGFAMIDSVSLHIEGQEVEKLSGDYMELHDELHRKPGQALQEAVFKYDRVTVPELAALSKTARTLYVPLPFFFTRGPHCILPVGKHFDAMIGRTVKVEVHCQLRAIDQIAIALPLSGSGSIGIPEGLDWSKISVQLYVQQIYLEEAESKAMWMSSGSTGSYRAMCTTVQALHGKSSVYPNLDSSGTIDRKKIPLRFPTKNIIFAIADQERLGRSVAANAAPFGSSGVSALFGTKSLHSSSSDWNAVKSGSKNLATITSVGDLRSSGDVKEWRADGQAGALFLPGNRFDYRAAENGVECEPVKTFSLKLNAQERVNTNLQPSYLRTVQTLAFNNRPRKGIYTYSFALDSSSPYPTGTVNFSRIHNRDLRITANGNHGGPGDSVKELILYAESINIFEIAAGKTAGQFAYTA